ncbi:MAG TPA: D-alanyl-D-alanine carboxypeptidase [Caulobacteraceae bacterium]|nr:D-alanyl-D-alanine carboxypeptidase [Caulobacteraceae bacterium]
MHEPARRLSYVMAALAASICVSATPTIAQDDESAPPMVGYSPSTSLRVPSDEPRYAAIVMDAATGEILYQKRADSPRYPASITKIMTMYLAFEALATGRLHETDMITVSPLAASQAPTKLGLRPGDTIDVEDAMHAIAVKSANDMAVALAEKIGGSESRFAAMMTMKAQELGMTHSHFVNANGLPDSRQITSAHDIAILCRAVLRDYPQYYGYFGTEQFTYRGVTMNNHNGLLGRMPGVDGFKTGFTNAAGYNLAASAVRDGRRLITVVMGGSSGAARNANVEDLLLTGFDVEERRSRGENIILTENMFEQPPASGYVTPQIEQGDTDDDDAIDVVLNAATHGSPVTFAHGGVTQLAASRPSLTPEVPRAGLIRPNVTQPSAQAGEPRNWTVQVGDYRSGPLATREVDFVADRFKTLFDDKEGTVDHVGDHYRAVFSGFTESEAKEACAALSAGAQPCSSSAR